MSASRVRSKHVPGLSAEIPDKLYFKIGEVAQLVGVEAHVLRYWEKEVSSIRPGKSASNQRRYRRRDVELFREIRRLLHEEKYTLAGARKRLMAGDRTVTCQTTQASEPAAPGDYPFAGDPDLVQLTEAAPLRAAPLLPTLSTRDAPDPSPVGPDGHAVSGTRGNHNAPAALRRDGVIQSPSGRDEATVSAPLDADVRPAGVRTPADEMVAGPEVRRTPPRRETTPSALQKVDATPEAAFGAHPSEHASGRATADHAHRTPGELWAPGCDVDVIDMPEFGAGIHLDPFDFDEARLSSLPTAVAAPLPERQQPAPPPSQRASGLSAERVERVRAGLRELIRLAGG